MSSFRPWRIKFIIDLKARNWPPSGAPGVPASPLGKPSKVNATMRIVTLSGHGTRVSGTAARFRNVRQASQGVLSEHLGLPGVSSLGAKAMLGQTRSARQACGKRLLPSRCPVVASGRFEDVSLPSRQQFEALKGKEVSSPF